MIDLVTSETMRTRAAKVNKKWHAAQSTSPLCVLSKLHDGVWGTILSKLLCTSSSVDVANLVSSCKFFSTIWSQFSSTPAHAEKVAQWTLKSSSPEFVISRVLSMGGSGLLGVLATLPAALSSASSQEGQSAWIPR